MKLFIVIVSYNSGNMLNRLTENLVKEGKLKIVIVDNGNVELRITNNKSRIAVIKNQKNLGFAKAANIGIRYALEKGADRVLLLNPDVEIEKDFTRELINNPSDIVSPVVKFKRGNKWLYDYGGIVDWNIGRTTHLDSAKPIDYVSGCCMLVKRKVFEKIGFFDERFFLYFEDADFCLRAKKAGFSIGVSLKSKIIHKLVEGPKRSDLKKYHLLRSNAIFINKYLGLNRLLGYLYLSAFAIKMML